jgi:hypothetical protein
MPFGFDEGKFVLYSSKSVQSKTPPGGPGGVLVPGSAYSPLALRPRDQIRL